MTKSPQPARKPIPAAIAARRSIPAAMAAHAPIAAILLLALLLRLDGLGFGLPALNDPDEPLFMMTAIDMLARHSLNPQWFGHPGTVTLYGLALVMLLVAVLGIARGRFADASAFAGAVYADPGIVFLPARLFIVASGLACVWLTYRIGRRLWGRRAGLAAALVLAVNPVHITWSQVIRTDMQASAFMLACVLCAIAIHRQGRLRDIVLAGLFAGLAVATKWPAAAILLCPLCAGLSAGLRARRPGGLARALLVVPVAVAALLAVSPYLLIDHATVLRDLTAEARPMHPGATGHGFLGNIAWYGEGPLAASFGVLGLVAAVGGAILAAWGDRAWRIAVCPGFALFLLVVSTQHLIWERWLVPVLPFLALGLGWSLDRAVGAIASWRGRLAGQLALLALLALVLTPMLATVGQRAEERRHDTRQLASVWLRGHVPPGSSILVEHAAIDLLRGPWTVLFPLGSAGCIDARAILQRRVSAPEVEKSRGGQPVVDLGHVAPALIDTCRADYAVLSHYERYRAERATYPGEYARYADLIAGGRVVRTFAPVAGQVGGPPVEIVRLRKAR
ncbi:ArnT family glycosyltransferase [Novosphingobium album (ex Liu et al. 2023)]|nr:glycosyltransferase family 39 protein [Novosphingobium album (ex Liu et al. 2023)]